MPYEIACEMSIGVRQSSCMIVIESQHNLQGMSIAAILALRDSPLSMPNRHNFSSHSSSLYGCVWPRLAASAADVIRIAL